MARKKIRALGGRCGRHAQGKTSNSVRGFGLVAKENHVAVAAPLGPRRQRTPSSGGSRYASQGRQRHWPESTPRRVGNFNGWRTGPEPPTRVAGESTQPAPAGRVCPFIIIRPGQRVEGEGFPERGATAW